MCVLLNLGACLSHSLPPYGVSDATPVRTAPVSTFRSKALTVRSLPETNVVESPFDPQPYRISGDSYICIGFGSQAEPDEDNSAAQEAHAPHAEPPSAAPVADE
ncbi:MAG: hypothetical protein AAF645_15020 [Myxococcota bacterium]